MRDNWGHLITTVAPAAWTHIPAHLAAPVPLGPAAAAQHMQGTA